MTDADVPARRAALEEALVEHRPRLRLHCYRMVASLEDAEDLTQETALRAWQSIDRFDGRSGIGTWLHRIATNACLDHLRGRARERRPRVPAADFARVPAHAAVPWLQPYPGDADALADAAPSAEAGPEERITSRESLRLAFVAATQYLPPRQRAVLLLRDCLGWSVSSCAEAITSSPASVNSALQRARATMRTVLDEDPERWAGAADSSSSRDLVEEYVAAIETADDSRIRRLLATEVRVSHGPGAGGNMTSDVAWYAGADTVLEEWAPILHVADRPEIAMRAVRMNGGPGVASWVRAPGGRVFEAFGLTAMTVIDGRVAEVATFGPELFEAFDLPQVSETAPRA